jgi:hypothetical protein
MAGVKAPWWKWYTCDYVAGVMSLDLRQQGAWMRLISHAQMNGDNPGHVQANLAWLSADFKESIEMTWSLLCHLALLKICDVSVDAGTGMKLLDEAFMASLEGHEKPAAHWRFEVTARRVEKDAMRRKTEIDRKTRQTENAPSSSTTPRKIGHLPEQAPGETGIFLARVEAEEEAEEDHPPTPSKKSRRKSVGRVAFNTPTMIRIGKWFGRKETTLWATDEHEKLKALKPPEDELDVLERYYASEHPEIAPYRRRQLVTLLNNWTADVDKARSMLERYAGDGSGERATAGGRRMASMAVV